MFYESNINKASLLREDNKNEEAAEVLTKVIEVTFRPDFIMAVLQRGIAYRLEGQMPQALNDFNTVLLYQPHNVQNLSNLAQTYYAMRFFNEASHFAALGLKEAEIQNKHECDVEFSEVINRINAMSRTFVHLNENGQKD